MKTSKSNLHRKFHSIPELKFEEQTLTSFSGLILFQRLFIRLNLKDRLRRCLQHLPKKQYGALVVFLMLMLHALLGYRQLRHQDYYRDDPIVKRILGVQRLPNVTTVSRTLSQFDETANDKLHELMRDMVLSQLRQLSLTRITLDFDGTVLGCGRKAEGSAVGFNRKKKGQRSYYPLFCTIPQLGQAFDVLFRPGKIHDSNGAKAFILECVEFAREALPKMTIELRMDSAFFSDDIISALDDIPNLEYSISVPFARFAQLKSKIETRQRWQTLDERFSFFERQWKPDSWDLTHRFIFLRQRVKQQTKEPLQLDLFEPMSYDHAYTVIVTNKMSSVEEVMAFHHGRGSQEGLFAELKSQNHLDYIPCNHWDANRAYLLAVVYAHNMNRELQMVDQAPTRNQNATRHALWTFEKIGTLRKKLIQRAGRLIRPQGHLTLSMAANDAVQNQFFDYMERLDSAA